MTYYQKMASVSGFNLKLVRDFLRDHGMMLPSQTFRR